MNTPLSSCSAYNVPRSQEVVFCHVCCSLIKHFGILMIQNLYTCWAWAVNLTSIREKIFNSILSGFVDLEVWYLEQTCMIMTSQGQTFCFNIRKGYSSGWSWFVFDKNKCWKVLALTIFSLKAHPHTLCFWGVFW